MLSQINKKYICDLFQEYLDDYSVGWKALWWEWTYEQEKRFEILLNNLTLSEDSTFLDLWCGTGDLFEYIRKNWLKLRYTWMDILKESINIAHSRFQDADFSYGETSDIWEWKYDYIVASGIFAVNIENAKKIYFNMIKEVFKKSKKGFIFNMLRDDFLLPNAPEIIQMNPIEVTEYCGNFCSKIIIEKNYLPIDFTIWLYHV